MEATGGASQSAAAHLSSNNDAFSQAVGRSVPNTSAVYLTEPSSGLWAYKMRDVAKNLGFTDRGVMACNAWIDSSAVAPPFQQLLEQHERG